MEQLRAELSHLLGEKLSRVECVSEKADTALWSLYDSEGNPMPLMARSFTSPGVARQLAWKMSMLAREGTVRMPTVYGVMTHEEHPGPDVLLIERLRGVPVEAPARTPERWEQLKDQIVEALLAWHRQDSRGLVGPVDSTQENLWPLWYRQRVEVLWGTLNQFNNTGLTMQDKRILFRTRECLPALFEGFNDNCVLIHGNFTLHSMLKDPAAISFWRWWGRGSCSGLRANMSCSGSATAGRRKVCCGITFNAPPLRKRFSGGAGSTCSGTKLRSWLTPDALIAQTSIWRLNHSCPGSPEEPFSHCQRRPSVS